jgi:hypothetical protein
VEARLEITKCGERPVRNRIERLESATYVLGNKHWEGNHQVRIPARSLSKIPVKNQLLLEYYKTIKK